MKRFFFGKLDPDQHGAGHNLYRIEGEPPNVVVSRPEMIPIVLDPGRIDQKLTPATDTRQGAARLCQRSGYTFLAWHDYTGDSRPGSNSIFIVEGSHQADDMLNQFSLFCPAVAKRQTRPVVVVRT